MELHEIITELGLSGASQKEATPIFDIERERLAELSDKIVNGLGVPLALMFAEEEKRHGFSVFAIFRLGGKTPYFGLRAKVSASDPHYPSVTINVMAAHWYERLIHDMFGLVADGHPDFRRLVHHENIPAGTHPLKKDFAWNEKLKHANEPYPMHAVEGRGVFEIPVGPIHAGIIEPGHFRFNVIGERIITLEGKLFFKHKGVEKLLEGKTAIEAMPFIERISGDMPIGHALAFCQAVESVAGTEVPERAKYLRVVLGEYERIIMHMHDISNIGGNGTALSFMFAQGSRLVERLRRVAEKIYGHRFLRGNIIPGGVTRDLSAESIKELNNELDYLRKELDNLEKIARNSDSFMERLETTGVLKPEAAAAYGAVGLPARASGLDWDVRAGAPYAAYGKLATIVKTELSCDVYARFIMRFREVRESIRLIKEALATMPPGPLAISHMPRAGEALGYAESWRGEVLDWVKFDKEGKLERAVIRDPSFCNWPLFGELAPGNIVPDFPICNKSLNLSYSGNDL